MTNSFVPKGLDEWKTRRPEGRKESADKAHGDRKNQAVHDQFGRYVKVEHNLCEARAQGGSSHTIEEKISHDTAADPTNN